MKALFPILLMIALVAPANADRNILKCSQLVDTGLTYKFWENPKSWASVEFDDSYDRQFYAVLYERRTVVMLHFGEGDARWLKCNPRTFKEKQVLECMSETGFRDTPDYGATHLFYLSGDLKRFQYILPSVSAYLEGDGIVRAAIGDCDMIDENGNVIN